LSHAGQANPLTWNVRRIGCAPVAVEHVWEIGGGYAHAMILDLEDCPASAIDLFSLHANDDLSIGRGVLGGIVQQVSQSPAQLSAVRLHYDRCGSTLDTNVRSIPEWTGGDQLTRQPQEVNLLPQEHPAASRGRRR
jgi:hypothetical protein